MNRGSSSESLSDTELVDTIHLATTKQELLQFGYKIQNINKEIIYKDIVFKLVKPGFKRINQKPMLLFGTYTYELKPEWIMKVGDIDCRIIDIS
jgi:hypothetical protein